MVRKACRLRRFADADWLDCGKGAWSFGPRGAVGLVHFTMDVSSADVSSSSVAPFIVPPMALRAQPPGSEADPTQRRWLFANADGALLSITLKDHAAALRFREAFDAAAAANGATMKAAGDDGSAAAPLSTSTRALFGGAIAATIPARFVDISTFRDVPDAQEVFADEACAESLVVEVLEYQVGTSDERSLSNCWDDICTANEASALDHNFPRRFEVLDCSRAVPRLAARSVACCAILGAQLCSKSRAEDVDLIDVALVVVRLPSVGSSLVVHMNLPSSVGGGAPGSSAEDRAAWTRFAARGEAGEAEEVEAEEEEEEAAEGDVAAAAPPVDLLDALPPPLRALLASLEVRDWGLFG